MWSIFILKAVGCPEASIPPEGVKVLVIIGFLRSAISLCSEFTVSFYSIVYFKGQLQVHLIIPSCPALSNNSWFWLYYCIFCEQINSIQFNSIIIIIEAGVINIYIESGRLSRGIDPSKCLVATNRQSTRCCSVQLIDRGVVPDMSGNQLDRHDRQLFIHVPTRCR